jgi:tripartite-type tricarboxylate transporter receptor subunit TctC
LVFGIALLLAPCVASAQYPAKPVRIIVPFTPASATDILGRVVADQFTKSLGQPFIVENKPGAGGIVGTEGAKAD